MTDSNALPPPAGLSLVLFFTRGMSLGVWDECGLFSREVALYRRLQERGVRVAFITYGDAGDLHYAEQLPGLTICCNRWGLPLRWYELLLPWLHRCVLGQADLLKTNQMNGADIALRCARRWRKPLLARCGYLWSKNESLEWGSASRPACKALAVEVDTERFAPRGRRPGNPPRLCFVGRLSPEKNLESLIRAVEGLGVELEIIGQGPLREKLTAMAADNPKVRFIGTVPHHQLPERLNQGTAFVLPSLYEGHPKTLIEAMACGLPVIGTAVSGISEVIRHREAGWLCPTDVESLRAAICTVLADPDLQERLGRNAREHVLSHYALDRVVEMELETYRNILCEGGRSHA
jgi:glycosyltransferase involved in cell wall biosynthesis